MTGLHVLPKGPKKPIDKLRLKLIIHICKKYKIRLTELLKDAELKHRNCLIAKSTATGGGVASTALIMTSLLSAPMTMGIGPLICGGIGFALGCASSAVGIGTEIVNHVIVKKHFNEIIECAAEYETEVWNKAVAGVYELHDEVFPEKTWKEETKGDRMHRWHFLKSIIKDKKTEINDLRPGDHIYRRCSLSNFRLSNLPNSFAWHHGIYLGRNGTDASNDDEVHNVADFGGNGKTSPARITTLEKFLAGNTKIYVRHYGEFEIDRKITIDLALKYINGEKKWKAYKLLDNNCEHFASKLKLLKAWSHQAFRTTLFRYSSLTIAKKLPRPLVIGCDIAEIALDLTTATATTAVKAAATTGKATAAMVAKVTSLTLGPVLTAVDIAILCHDWKKTQPTVQKIKNTIDKLDKEISMYEKYLNDAETKSECEMALEWYDIYK